jgi:hypothetical protein
VRLRLVSQVQQMEHQESIWSTSPCPYIHLRASRLTPYATFRTHHQSPRSRPPTRSAWTTQAAMMRDHIRKPASTHRAHCFLCPRYDDHFHPCALQSSPGQRFFFRSSLHRLIFLPYFRYGAFDDIWRPATCSGRCWIFAWLWTLDCGPRL